MAYITESFRDFLNEKKHKSFYDIAKRAQDSYDEYDMELKKTKKGFTYLDYEGDEIEVIVKGNKASIVDGDQNMSMDDFADMITGGDVEVLYEAQKYDVLASVKDIKNFNRSKRSDADLIAMIESILKNLGYKNTDDNYEAAENHILASTEDDKKVPEDKDLVEELYDILESVSVNEARVQYKRRYTENHPARTMNSNTKIRSKILEAIGDGVITEEELIGILKELNANPRWFKRNSNLFKITENGICLSKTGKRMFKHTVVANPVNEEEPVSIEELKSSNSFLMQKVDESFIANPDDAVQYVVDNYKKITGEKYDPENISDKAAGKIDRFVKKQKLDVDSFWDSWLKYNHV